LIALAAIVPIASALAQTSIAETRARAVVQAFSIGDATAFEHTAQANYTPAALARRQPAQRAQTLQQIHNSFGELHITAVTANGPTIVATTSGAQGGQAVFTFTIAGRDQRIDAISIQTSGVAAMAPARTDNPYAAYAFLIGEWDTSAPAGSAEGAIRQSLRWGPSNSYIWYGVYNRLGGAAQEQLHQEGIMVFNAQRNNLDFLFVHEPGSYGEEQGSVHAEPDGSIVRETNAVAGDGAVTHFRQTWRRTGDNTAVTSLMRQRQDGSWEPNFPGADNLVMTRRAA